MSLLTWLLSKLSPSAASSAGDELALGTAHELEHVGDQDIAHRIAKANLDGDPDYYRKVQKRALEKYSDDQPRDESGRWTDGGGGGASEAPPVRTDDVEVAVRALAEGRQVELTQPRQVATLIDRLAAVAKEAEARGEKAPRYDLCKVTVVGTNVFCVGGAGIPRVKMPQLYGVPVAGSPADALPKDRFGETDIGPAFLEHLRAAGREVEETTEEVSHLRATQSELVGPKVAVLMGIMRKDPQSTLRTNPLFVSEDNYIVDGHHRWAANVGLDFESDSDAPIRVPVKRVNMRILPLLEEAHKFAAAQGLPTVGFKRARAVEKYSDDQERDEAGRWTGVWTIGAGTGWVKADGEVVSAAGKDHGDVARKHGAKGKNSRERVEWAVDRGWVKTTEGRGFAAVEFNSTFPAACSAAAAYARDMFNSGADSLLVDRWAGPSAGEDYSDSKSFSTLRSALAFIQRGEARKFDRTTDERSVDWPPPRFGRQPGESPRVRLKPRLPLRRSAADAAHGVDGSVYLYKGADHGGVMVAVRLPLAVAGRVALPGGEAPEDLHCTLAYLGDVDVVDPDKLQALHDNLAAVAGRTPPFLGRVRGYGRFTNGDDDVVWAGLDAPDLAELRHAALGAARDAGLEPAGDHGFTPHVTLGYAADDTQMAGWLEEMERRQDSPEADEPVEVGSVSLAWGGREAALRLRGDPDAGDAEPQAALPASTFSELQRPADVFESAAGLAGWRRGRGPVLVRSDVAGLDCVIVKKGGDVHVGVAGLDGDAVQLADLVDAMRRVDHDYVVVGRLGARDLEGRWLEPDEVAGVLDASTLATPVFFPTDLLVMDGDLAGRPARERWELLRALVPDAGAHVVVPPQVESAGDGDFADAVESALAWRPSDGEGLLSLGVVCVVAGSKYEHGPTDDVARTVLAWSRKYSEDQARDESGQWTDEPGGVRPKLRGKATAYHSTSERFVSNILENGLLRSKEGGLGHGPAVYFTTSKADAKNLYAGFGDRGEKEAFVNYAIVEFDRPTDAESDADAGEAGGSYYVESDIPASAIRGVQIFRTDDNKLVKTWRRKSAGADDLAYALVLIDATDGATRPARAAAQKNRKLHFRTEFQGLPVSIETQRGSYREWNDPLTGRSGRTKMPHHYGYIRLTEGADGDLVDCFLGPEPDATHAYVVRQLDPETGEYDEDKVMLGFATEAEAKTGYLASRDDGERAYGGVAAVPMGEFRRRVGRMTLGLVKFDESQPRDERGRWTVSPGLISPSGEEHRGSEKGAFHHDEIAQKLGLKDRQDALERGFVVFYRGQDHVDLSMLHDDATAHRNAAEFLFEERPRRVNIDWEAKTGARSPSGHAVVSSATYGGPEGWKDAVRELRGRVKKDFAFGAGPGVGTEPPDWERRPKADQAPRPNFLEPEKALYLSEADVEKYDPDQPRDEAGKWSETGVVSGARTEVEPTREASDAWWGSLNADERAAMDMYTSNVGHIDMNKILRAEPGAWRPTNPAAESAARVLSDVLKRTAVPDRVVSWRGVRAVETAERYARFKAMRPGDEFVDRGFMSTSPDERLAREYMRGDRRVLFKLTLRGALGAYVEPPPGATKLEDWPSSEWLLAPGATVRVTAATKMPRGGVLIEAEVGHAR